MFPSLDDELDNRHTIELNGVASDVSALRQLWRPTALRRHPPPGRKVNKFIIVKYLLMHCVVFDGTL
jgi:hypothetical protein